MCLSYKRTPLKDLMESTNLPRKECCLIRRTISGTPEAPEALSLDPSGEPRSRLHGGRCLGPVALGVLQFCNPWRRKPDFPAPLLQPLLPTDQVTLEMDGEVPQGRDLERGHPCVRGRE